MSSVLDDWHTGVRKSFDSKEWVDITDFAGSDAVWIQVKPHSGDARYNTEIHHTHYGLRRPGCLWRVDGIAPPTGN